MSDIRQATTVEELEYNGKPMVICFTNPLTCAPCKMLYPHYKVAAHAFNDSVEFWEVNVLEHMDVAEAYGVRGTPTVIYKDEAVQVPIVARTAIQLVEEINALAN